MPKKKTIPEKIFDSTLKDQINLDKFSVGLNQDVQKLLKSAQDEIVAAIAKNDPTAPTMTKWKAARLENLNQQISEILDNTFEKAHATTKTGLVEAGKLQARSVLDGVNSSVGVDIFQVTLTPAEVKAIVENTLIDGSTIGDWWNKQSSTAKAKMAASMAAGTQALQIGLVQGESVGDLISRIRGTKTTPGIMSVTKREATALVRTSVMQVANAVRQEIYKANTDVLDGLEIISTLDARTCSICRPLDGKRYDMEMKPNGHSSPWPGMPVHWNCRCTTIPVIKSYKDLVGENSPLTSEQINTLDSKVPVGQRASMNGPVAGNLTYNDWLLLQPVDIQKEILGPGRWNLWTANKLDMVDLVDNAGMPITLKELKANMGDILAQKEVALEKDIQQLAIESTNAVDFEKKIKEIYSKAIAEQNIPIGTLVTDYGSMNGDMASINKKAMFHYTGEKQVANILENGIQLSDNSMYGKGVYFTDHPKYTSSYSARVEIKLKPHIQAFVNDDTDMMKFYSEQLGRDVKSFGERERIEMLNKGIGSVAFKVDEELYTLVLNPDLIQFENAFTKEGKKLFEAAINPQVQKIISEKGGYSKLFADIQQTVEAQKAAAAEKRLINAINNPEKVVTFKKGQTLPPGLYEPIKDAVPALKEGDETIYGKLKFKVNSELAQPMETIPGLHNSAGMIVIDDSTPGQVWLCSPTKQFGGYKNTFPKGTLEKVKGVGPGIQEQAIREVFEETGIEAKPIYLLGDYQKTTSNTRYFVGIKTGGSPVQMGWESEAVQLVPINKLDEVLNMAIDKEIAKDFVEVYNQALKASGGDFNSIQNGFDFLTLNKGALKEWDELIQNPFYKQIAKDLGKQPGFDDFSPLGKTSMLKGEAKATAQQAINTWQKEKGTVGSEVLSNFKLTANPVADYQAMLESVKGKQKEYMEKLLELNKKNPLSYIESKEMLTATDSWSSDFKLNFNLMKGQIEINDNTYNIFVSNIKPGTALDQAMAMSPDLPPIKKVVWVSKEAVKIERLAQKNT